MNDKQEYALNRISEVEETFLTMAAKNAVSGKPSTPYTAANGTIVRTTLSLIKRAIKRSDAEDLRDLQELSEALQILVARLRDLGEE